MMHNFIGKLGDYNPQLFREIKGRLKPRNILLAITISVISQFLLLMSFFSSLPSSPEPGINFDTVNEYCTGELQYSAPQCVLDDFGNVVINWQAWSLNLFVWLSGICIFALLVMGTYLLINDLATEERRDTLNFLRLTPQKPQTILLGKMMGVPILLYLAVFLTIPLHLWSGFTAKVPFPFILSFYGVLFTACTCYYSVGLLFGLVGSWLGGFQSWLASGAVLGFLTISLSFLNSTSSSYYLTFIRFLNPFFLVPHLEHSSMTSSWDSFSNNQVASLNLGTIYILVLAFSVLNYAILNYFTWQGLKRCFRDPNETMLSKNHSYLLMFYFATFTVLCGFGVSLRDNIFGLLFFNFGAFLCVIAAITPHRQSLVDWARYRRVDFKKRGLDSFLIKDLISNDKSPAILALMINAVIAIACISTVIILAKDGMTEKTNGFIALGLAFSLATLYVVIVQISLFMKTRHRIVASIFTLSTTMILPLIVAGVLLRDASKHTFLWLFSFVAPAFALYPSYSAYGIMTEGLLAVICHLAIAAFLTFQFSRNLQKAGESQTKEIINKNLSVS